MSDKVHIVFRLKGRPLSDKSYYQRDGTQSVAGRHIPVPEVATEVRAPLTLHARPFAVSVRDRWRKVFGDKYDIYIESPDGTGPLLEPRDVPTQEGEDEREPCFVLPDGFEQTGFGFLVRPAIRPEGRGWCVRAADVPSLIGRDFESIYGDTPIQAVERALATWGALAQPSPAPWADQQDNAETRRILHEFEKSKRLGTGRRRPGDR